MELLSMRSVILFMTLFCVGISLSCSDPADDAADNQNADAAADTAAGEADTTAGEADTTAAPATCQYDDLNTCAADAGCKWFDKSCPGEPDDGLCIHVDMHPQPPVCP